MTFHELLKKYKNGTVTEEEKRLVEEELEKNEAINDYLAESINDELIKSDSIKDGPNYTKKIKHNVNKKLIKVIAASVLIVFIILLGTKYIISPIVACTYYDPTQISFSSYCQDIFFDFRAITELTHPGYSVSYATATNDDFGCYNYSLTSQDTFTGKEFITTGNIKRNKNINSTNNPLVTQKNYILGLWSYPRNTDELTKSIQGENKVSENRITDLKDLPKSSYISAYIYLREDVPAKDIFYMQTAYNLDFIWAGVNVSDSRTPIPLGFKPSFNYDSSPSCNDIYFKKYPLLTLSDAFEGGGGFNEGSSYELHFKTLLNYLSERQNTVKTLIPYSLDIDSYKDYIDKNGITCYGILVYGSVDEIVKFYNERNALSISIDNVLPSKYSSPNYN